VLAIVDAEPGADLVRTSPAGAVMSAVNYSEVLKKTIERGGTGEAAASFAARTLGMQLHGRDRVPILGRLRSRRPS